MILKPNGGVTTVQYERLPPTNGIPYHDVGRACDNDCTVHNSLVLIVRQVYSREREREWRS